MQALHLHAEHSSNVPKQQRSMRLQLQMEHELHKIVHNESQAGLYTIMACQMSSAAS